jgi:hypothetical protein
VRRSFSCWPLRAGAGLQSHSVPESNVYRVLRLHGVVREVNVVGFPAGPDYTVKTTRVNEQSQSNASYFFVVGWGNLQLSIGTIAGRCFDPSPGEMITLPSVRGPLRCSPLTPNNSGSARLLQEKLTWHSDSASVIFL